ncbi:hypothetical protein OG312_01785 [Kocuria rhizophila]|uniref:hypothetical protein n=1 Tax=Kocuria rhizophila TaxID=72000 RepID=UPI002E12CDFC|nr:hypothetical protein OG312_01785 [Kocuria rhizophila]
MLQRELGIVVEVARGHHEVLGHAFRVAGFKGLELVVHRAVELPTGDVRIDLRGHEPRARVVETAPVRAVVRAELATAITPTGVAVLSAPVVPRLETVPAAAAASAVVPVPPSRAPGGTTVVAGLISATGVRAAATVAARIRPGEATTAGGVPVPGIPVTPAVRRVSPVTVPAASRPTGTASAFLAAALVEAAPVGAGPVGPAVPTIAVLALTPNGAPIVPSAVAFRSPALTTPPVPVAAEATVPAVLTALVVVPGPRTAIIAATLEPAISTVVTAPVATACTVTLTAAVVVAVVTAAVVTAARGPVIAPRRSSPCIAVIAADTAPRALTLAAPPVVVPVGAGPVAVAPAPVPTVAGCGTPTPSTAWSAAVLAAAPATALTLVPPTIRVIAGTVLIRCAQGVSPTAASGLGVQVIDGRCPLVC